MCSTSATVAAFSGSDRVLFGHERARALWAQNRSAPAHPCAHRTKGGRACAGTYGAIAAVRANCQSATPGCDRGDFAGTAASPHIFPCSAMRARSARSRETSAAQWAAPGRQEVGNSAPEYLHPDAEENEGRKPQQDGGRRIAQNSLNTIGKRETDIYEQRERGIGGKRRKIEQKAVLERDRSSRGWCRAQS